MKITPLQNWISEKIGRHTGGKILTDFSRQTIEQRQLEKLNETIAWAAAKSPFYRERLAGFKDGGLSCLKDLERLPFTTAEDIRHNTLQFLCVSQSDINRVVTLPTSGTTGDPKRIFFTEEDQELTIDFFHHGMSTLVEPGNRVLILLPGERPGSVGDLLQKGLERLGAVGIPHGVVKDVWNTLDIMDLEKVDTLVGAPVQVLALARFGNGKASPGSVLLSTDYVPLAIIRELHRIWGCETFTHYGMTEMGYGGGVECRAHFGYHMREADLFFEIVDTATGKPAEKGRSGEVVFTTLTRRGMPLIRYKTGDISRFIPEECPCGTILESMERVEGRVEGKVELGEAEFLSMADLDEALFPLDGVLDFSAELTHEKNKNHLHICIRAVETAGGRLESLALRALESAPSLRSACERDSLVLSIDVRQERQIVLDGFGKRRIVDRRARQ